MAIANVIRVSVMGTQPGGEVWSVNPVFQIGGTSTSEDVTPEQCLEIATAIDAITIPAGLLAILNQFSNFNGTRVEARRWDGTLAAQAEHVRTPVYGTGTTSTLPYQSSLVASLRTAGFGGSSRGRLYWPATGVPLTASTFRVSSSNVTSALAGVKTYLTSVTTALEATLVNDCHLAVWSRTNNSTQWVNSIQMGDVIDTQRRRRDSLPEAYLSTSYP